jgi:hypothetical protein
MTKISTFPVGEKPGFFQKAWFLVWVAKQPLGE